MPDFERHPIGTTDALDSAETALRRLLNAPIGASAGELAGAMLQASGALAQIAAVKAARDA